MKRLVYVMAFVLTSLLHAYEYPDAVVDTYINNCSQGTPRSTCRCAIEKFQEELPYRDFLALSNRIATGTFTSYDAQAVQTITISCGGDVSSNQASPPSTSLPRYDYVAAECKRLEKRIDDCNKRTSKMSDGISKSSVQNSCGQMELQYTSTCLNR